MPTANNPPAEVAVEDRVWEIISQVIDAIKGQLLANAQAIAIMGVNETAQLLKQAGINLLTQRQDVQKLVTKLVNDYANNLAKGGSMCVERVVKQVTPTTAEITPKHVFVSWLDDLQKEVVQEVTDIITHDYAAGIHPYGTTEKLRDYLLRPKHRFEVAARTEAQKLRTDAKVRMMQENGVHYVRYITAGDDRVRPEHQLRNNKIYRMEYAPWLGEYNCRCTLVPADRDVKQGATVTESATETVPIEAANISLVQALTPPAPAPAPTTAKKPELPTPTKLDTYPDPVKTTEPAPADKGAYAGIVLVDTPVIAYPEIIAPKDSYPKYVIQMAKGIEEQTKAVMDYTGLHYMPINKLLRRKISTDEAMERWEDYDEIVSDIHDLDSWIQGEVISPIIHGFDKNGVAVEYKVPKIYRGLSGKTVTTPIIDTINKLGLEEAKKALIGHEISDLSFQSWSIKKEVSTEKFAHLKYVGNDTQTKMRIVLVEDVEPGTIGKYIGTASSNSNEGEVLRPRGLISIIDKVMSEEDTNNNDSVVTLYVHTHLKRG